MALRSRGLWAVAVFVLAACGGRSTLGLAPDAGDGRTAGSGGSAAIGGALSLGGTGGNGARGGVSGTSGNGGSSTSGGGAFGGASGGGLGGASGAAGKVPNLGDDTSLRSLSLSDGYLAPLFDPHQLEYSVTLPRGIESVSVKVVANDPEAEVMIGNEVADGPVDVATKEGGGTIPIVVSAENGATGTTYVRYRSELVESTTYVKPSNTAEFAQFGISLSLAGDTLVVGAHEETGYDSAGKDWPMGAAHVFVKGDDGWHEQAALSPTQPGHFPDFGYAVAFSGDTLVIGAPGDSRDASGVTDGAVIDDVLGSSGAAYVYVREGGGWHQQAYLKAESPYLGAAFGGALALEGDTLVVGASGEPRGDIQYAGTATVFVRDGDHWSLRQTLRAASPSEGGRFGSSVAISADTIAVGAIGEPFEGPDAGTSTWAGAVTVFEKEGSEWVEQAFLRAPRPSDHGYFGNGLDIEGELLVIGASGETGPYSDELGGVTAQAGAAYVFQRFEVGWANTTALLPSNGGEGHHFGARVALEGNLVAIGAPGETGSASGVNGDPARGGAFQSGAVYVFAYEHSTWKQAEYIKAVTSDPNDGFGCSLSFVDGELAVGAYGEASHATGVDGDSTDDSAPSAGAAYVYAIDDEPSD